MTELNISRRLQLTILFLSLLICKVVGLNGILDDLLTLVVGVILGVDVLSNAGKT